MANDRYFFDHDYTARNDDKILELRAEFGAEGYGVFWMLVETMAENENGGAKATLMGGLSLGYGVAKDRLMLILDFCVKVGLFYTKDDNGLHYFSNRMMKHKEFRKSLSVNGKKGAKIKWGNKKNSGANGGAIATPMLNITEHNKEDIVSTPIVPISEKKIRHDPEYITHELKLMQDVGFITQVMQTRYIKETHVMQNWIKVFNLHICGEGKEHEDYVEYRRHFKNWIVKQDTSKPPPLGIPAITTNGNYQNTEKLRAKYGK